MDQSYARGGIRVCDTGGVYSGDSESGGAVVASGLCDACPGCDDVCDSKLCGPCDKKRRSISHRQPSCPYGYTRCQVRRHKFRDDCWLIAHRKVYNATKFIDQHPAGPTPILNRAGTDCTVDYDFHSSYSQKTFWKPLCIGRLVHCPLKDGPAPQFFPCTIQ